MVLSNLAFAISQTNFQLQISAPALGGEPRKASRKIKIVAIGSSSTAGRGGCGALSVTVGNVAAATIPRTAMIDVLNRGMGGQEAAKELSRFEPDVFAEAPSLVIWQVGTNAVFRNEEFDFEEVVAAIAAGLRLAPQDSADRRRADGLCNIPPASLFDDKAEAIRATWSSGYRRQRQQRRGQCVSPLRR